jgi:hypothetical protein
MSPDSAAGEPPRGPDEGARGDAPPAGDAPDLAELERVAVPGVVRRAPRYRAFVGAGVLVGLLVTVGLGLATVRPDEPGGLTAVLLAGLGLVTVGGVLGGLVAVLLESRR